MDTVKMGSFLKELRKEKGLTQGQLAQQMNVTDRSVSRWETGVNMPDLDILLTLSELYGVDIKEILDGQRSPREEEAQQREVLEKVAAYSALKERSLLTRIFWVVMLGILALGVAVVINMELIRTVTGGGLVLLFTMLAFAVYTLCLFATRLGKTAQGGLAILISAFGAVILSNVWILLVFLDENGYYNYGMTGSYFIFGVILTTFLATGGLTCLLCKR